MKVLPIIPEYESMANMWLIIDEESNDAAVVDLGCFLGNAHKTIKDNGVNVKYLLLTHGHFDHILGVPHCKAEFKPEVVIHADDAICLESREYNVMDTFGVDEPFYPMKPDIIVKDGDVINLGKTKLYVMHTPGHSAGSVCYINYEDRVIFSGDTLFFSTVGRTDTIGGSDDAMRESIKKLIALDGDFTVYTGHGPQTSLSHERVRNIFVRRMNRQ